MHTFKKSFVLALSLTALTACTTSSQRTPASVSADTTLSGTRVNPVKYALGPKWKVRLHNGEQNKWEVGKLALTSYELGSERGLNDFKARVDSLLSEDKKAGASHKKGKGFLPKGASLALKEISQLVDLIYSRQLNERDQNDALVHISELATAFNLEFKYPIPRKLWILAAPFKLIEEFHNRPMTEAAPTATNLVAHNQQDTSKVDPVPSTFWRDPGNISSRDMYIGFDRTQMSVLDAPCKYDEPKTSYGVSTGFEVKCGDTKWKLKFGTEVRSEPFNSRLAHLLGYNALAIDFIKDLKIEYDRALLKEFNSRKELTTYVTSVFGFKYGKLAMQIYKDPFVEAVKGAVLKDGTKLNVKQLRSQLLKVATPQAEEKDENYDSNFESKIKYLVLNDTNAEPKVADNEKNVGTWDWNDLDHSNRRELRGFSILAAFMNSYDVRADNTKLRIVTDAQGRKSLKHIISDLGAGLGQAKDLLHQFDGEPNLYPWEVIEAVYGTEDISPVERGAKRTKFVERYKFKGYSVTFDNASFDRAQVEDARWLVRKLAQVTEAQFVDALIASGWSSAETKLYLEKLVSRRDNLVKELGLANEIPLLRPTPVNRAFNYDPRNERLYFVSSKPNITAPINNKMIVNGMVKSF